MITAPRWNEINREFWLIQQAETENLMRDPIVAHIAMRQIESDFKRGVRGRSQISFEQTVIDAKEQIEFVTPNIAERVTKQAARRAGSAPKKRDQLSQVILAAVRSNSELSENGLLHTLKKAVRTHFAIVAVDDTHVTFADLDGNLVPAPITGLKHRLSRAKRSLRAQNKESRKRVGSD